MTLLQSGLAKSLAEAYTIDQSLRFDDGSSQYLHWTPSSEGSQQKFTISVWVRRGNLATGSSQNIFNPNPGGDGANESQFMFNGSDKLQFYDSGGNRGSLTTTQVFRDVGAWYHIVIAVDTTEAVASDRINMYINGELVTAFDTEDYPALNAELGWGRNGSINKIGVKAYGSLSQWYDGYLAELYFIDGTQYAVSDFGETDDDTNQWKPIDASGLTFGTNGFYLKFQDSAAFGDDSSGNTNDFTVVDVRVQDQMKDSPTNSFCTLNPVVPAYGTLTFMQGNLEAIKTNSWSGPLGTMGAASGKWYWEILPQQALGASGSGWQGIVGDNASRFWDGVDTPQGTAGILYNQAGNKDIEGTQSTYGDTFTTGDIIGVALNMDDSEVTFYKNNVAQASGVAIAFSGDIANATFVTSASSLYNSTSYFNFGSDSSFSGEKTAQGNTDGNGIGDFYYAPPSGFKALCTSNLPTPSIKLPGKHFNTILWDGDGVSPTSMTGVGFQPDLVWSKARQDTWAHALADAVRGSENTIWANTTAADDDYYIWGYVSAFDSDGFTVTAGASGIQAWNDSTDIFVAWNWLGDGVDGGTLNEDGSEPSQVNVNTTAGFSIATIPSYSGNITFGHGLSAAPTCVIMKALTGIDQWTVGHSGMGDWGKGLSLNNTAAEDSNATFFNSTEPDASIVNLGAWDAGYTRVVYSFHSVEGYSKVDSYEGNGDADGTFIYTGFRPAFFLLKNSNTTDSWRLYDSKRLGFNVENELLVPNTNAIEGSVVAVDFLSNGFKVRSSEGGINGSGNTVCYLAFAESPFKYANAR